MYYWATPTAASHGRAPLHHAVTGAVIGERPQPDALRRLRAKVLRLLCVLCEARLTKGDAVAIVGSLRACRDAEVLREIVGLLLGWLTPPVAGEDPPPSARVGAALVARLAEVDDGASVYDTLADLLHGESEVLRLASLRLLALFVGAADASTLPPPDGLWSRVTHALGGWALTPATYAALADAMTGRAHLVTADPADARRRDGGGRAAPPHSAPAPPHRRAAAPDRAPLHLTDLCRADPANCAALMAYPGWQRPLLHPPPAAAPAAAAPAAAPAAAAPPPLRRYASSLSALPADGSADDDSRLVPLLMQLFLTLHGHALLAPRHGRGASPSNTRSATPPASRPAAPRRRRRRAVGVAAAERRLGGRVCSPGAAGAPQGACTSVLTALTHALENPNWLENLDGLLALAASFLFDDRSHVAHLGPSEATEADPDAFLAAGGASPNAPWVSCVGAGGSWDDAPLVTPLLQLLGLLGVGVAPQPARGPRDSGGDGGGDHPRVRAAWVAHCDGAGDRARKAGKKRLSLTPRLSTAAAPAGDRPTTARRRRPTAAARARRTARRPTRRAASSTAARGRWRCGCSFTSSPTPRWLRCAWGRTAHASRTFCSPSRRLNPPPPRAPPAAGWG